MRWKTGFKYYSFTMSSVAKNRIVAGPLRHRVRIQREHSVLGAPIVWWTAWGHRGEKILIGQPKTCDVSLLSTNPSSKHQPIDPQHLATYLPDDTKRLSPPVFPIMNSEAGYITAKKGQAVCRPSTWTDIGLFFAFNYGLHVITMVSPPGSSPFYNFTTALLSLLLPFSGIGTALQVIYRRGIQSASSDLQIAHRAGALCMLIRRDQVPEDSWSISHPVIRLGLLTT